jgi:hypothetical protein
VVTSIVENSFMWGIANQDFSDLQLDVDTTQISGPTNNNNGYGVMCRIQKNGDGYVFLISGDGFASIQIVQDGTSSTIVDWAETPEVIQGNSTNHLQAICSGSDLQLYANGTLVASTQDSTFTSGDIAFIVMSFEAEPSEVHFDNLVVAAPGTATSTPTTTTTNPTATPSTATTNPTSQPSISSLLHATALLQDDFSDPASGWEIGDYSGGSVGYGNGDYVITSTVDDSFMWGIANQDFTDISLDVDTNQVVGPTNNNNGYGVICRLQSSGDGYALRISGDGWAGIHLIQNGATSPLVDWAETPAVNQGNTTNHLRAVCSGSTLQLYVNDTLVAEVQDTTYASGDIAFMVASFEAEPSEIHFDNLIVNEP